MCATSKDENSNYMEYISDDKIVNFNIKKNIIYEIDKNIYLVKLTAKDFAIECEPWVYNRKINDEKVEELKEQFKVFDKETSPIWNISLVYDKHTHKSKDNIQKYLKILDGQHRWKLIIELLFNDEIDHNYEIYATCYFIDFCEEKNKHIATELFKKINNNTPLYVDDIPDTRVQEIIDRIIEDNELNPNKEGIKTKDAQHTAHEPAIHKKELFNILNPHSKNFSHLSIDEIIVNLRLIKNRIMLKDFKDIYRKCQKNLNNYEKAKSVDFWLGLKSSTKYCPEQWVLFIINPREFGK
jgi:hypothetical protein